MFSSLLLYQKPMTSGKGVAASAKQLFEELEMWDEIVQCYAIMDQMHEVPYPLCVPLCNPFLCAYSTHAKLLKSFFLSKNSCCSES